MISEVFSRIKSSVNEIIKKPLLLIPGILLLLVMFGISKISAFTTSFLSTSNYNNSVTFSSLLIITSGIILLILSYIFTGLISQSNKKSFSVKDYIKNSNKFFLKNFIIILVIILAFNLSKWIAFFISYFIGNAFNLRVANASLLFFILYLFGLLFFVSYFTYSSFFLVLKGKSIYESIKSSFTKTKNEYFETITFLLLIFLISSILEYLPNQLIAELISAIFLLPFISVYLSKAIK